MTRISYEPFYSRDTKKLVNAIYVNDQNKSKIVELFPHYFKYIKGRLYFFDGNVYKNAEVEFYLVQNINSSSDCIFTCYGKEEFLEKNSSELTEPKSKYLALSTEERFFFSGLLILILAIIYSVISMMAECHGSGGVLGRDIYGWPSCYEVSKRKITENTTATEVKTNE